MIRGFSTNRLLYSVDGVRMNTAIFRGGNLQNVINIDPFTIEKIEVLFGPGSVIYGSDAIGGVMSFKTLTPQLSLTDKTYVTGKAISRYSSANNEKTGHFDVNIGFKKWALITSVSAWDYNHLKQGQHGPKDYIKNYYVDRQDGTDVIRNQENELLQIPSAYSQTNLMQKIRYKHSDEWNFEYGFHLSETSPYGRYDRHNRVKNGTARYGEWNYGPQGWLMNNLAITHKHNAAIFDQLSIKATQQSFHESRIDRGFNKTDRRTTKEHVEAYSLNVDLIKTKGEKNTLFYGAEYVYNDIKSLGYFTDIATEKRTETTSRYPKSNWSSFGIYVNDDYEISKKITLQAGVRYNQFLLNTDFDTTYFPFPFTEVKLNNSAITGSLGGVYRPSETWVINFNSGTAFRSPNVDDIGKLFDSEPGAITIPNSNLKAEYVYNVDLGIAKVFNDVIKIDATGYYSYLENAIVRRDFKLNGKDSIIYDNELSQVQALQNAAFAEIYGLQAGIEINLTKGFLFSSDLNYQIGKEELDNGSVSPSRHAAPFFGTARFSYKAKDLHLQFYTNFQAEKSFDNLPDSEKGKDEIYAKDGNGNNYSPAWYTINFKANINVKKHFAISTGIENITDQRYRGFSSGISGAGRNFILSLKVKF